MDPGGLHDQRPADDAVTLAADVLGRVPAVVHGVEGADELRDRIGVLVIAQKSASFYSPSARLKPVPAGSTSTKSVYRSRLHSLSLSR